jgi:23S rRNA (cytosine1962-C5)-methyltransferase
VEVRSASGEWLARAAFSPASQIRARVLDMGGNQTVNESFFRARIERALSLRRAVVSPAESDAYRLIHGESDGLPGWWSTATPIGWWC